MPASQLFVKALQRQPISCPTPGCPGPVESNDTSQAQDQVKTFNLRCLRCGWQELVIGHQQQNPPWEDASRLTMTEAHLLHLQPTCPYDEAPVLFTSLPNPRRKARYRITCYYCGRQIDVDWPPPESKW